MEYIEINLIPSSIKNHIKMIKTVSICAEIFVITLLLVMWVTGFFSDSTTGIIFSFILLTITTPLLLPGHMFDKVSRSKVLLTDKYIHILDKKGVCWRVIDYNTITAVGVKDISGFFYGHNKDMFQNTYICIFLNGETNIPNVSYAKLFTEKNFIMFAYHYEASQWLLQRFSNWE